MSSRRRILPLLLLVLLCAAVPSRLADLECMAGTACQACSNDLAGDCLTVSSPAMVTVAGFPPVLGPALEAPPAATAASWTRDSRAEARPSPLLLARVGGRRAPPA